MEICRDLFQMQDPEYKAFHEKLIPTVDPALVIGVRTPALRAYAKFWANTAEAASFMQELPHRYYEENNLHGFFIEQIRDFDTCIAELDRFLPYVDNWATCDMLRPKCFSGEKDRLVPHLKRWLCSKDVYAVRFAAEMLMVHYLQDNFSPEYPALVANINCEEYYLHMMVAWYFATALAFRYEEILPWLQQKRLPKKTHNKAIQKATESRRLTPEQKKHLKTWMIP